MMKKVENIWFSLLACVLAVVIAMGILFIMHGRVMPVSEPAASCDKLEISVGFPAAVQYIRIWQDAEGVLYFFMPSGADNYEVKFSNLDKDSILWMDSKLYTSQNSVISEIEYMKTYEVELIFPEDNEVVETKQVIFLKSEGIPSLYIDTASGNMDAVHADKEVREAATISLIEADGSREYSGQLKYIKTRGNSTFWADKKSYQICFDRATTLLGMSEAKKWILLANAFDDSLIKNELVFRFAEEYTTVPSAAGRYVDLYLNENYVGNYYLCEKVEVGENRLDITNLDRLTEQVNPQSNYENAKLYVSEDGKIKAVEGVENPADITGGYLLEHTSSDIFQEIDSGFMTENGHCYMVISPSPATVEQVEYICNLFNEMETAIWREDGIHPETGKHFSEYLDIDSWTSKYLIEELFQDVDAREHSMFFYKDADSVDTRIFSGPMWDYDKSLGSAGNVYFFLNDPNRIGNLGIYADELMLHEEIREQVYRKFQECYLPYAKYLASADVYNFSEMIRESAEMDRIRWPKVNGYYADEEAVREHLVSFLRQKAEFLQKVWLNEEKYCTVTFLDYSGNIYTRYTVKEGDFLDSAPAISTFAAVFNGWYAVEDGTPFDNSLPILQDVTFESRWIDVSILLSKGLVVSEMDVSQVDADILRAITDQVEVRQNYMVEEVENSVGED